MVKAPARLADEQTGAFLFDCKANGVHGQGPLYQFVRSTTASVDRRLQCHSGFSDVPLGAHAGHTGKDLKRGTRSECP